MFSHTDSCTCYLIPQTIRATDRIKEMIEDKDDVVGIKVSVKRSKSTPIKDPLLLSLSENHVHFIN